jgi:ubiquinone biosynthesis monooxygenase Coq7
MPSPSDNLLIAADEALRTLAGVATAARKAPEASRETALDAAGSANRRRLMRVNHAGEICAQALYSGQALVARDERVRAALVAAGAEERDHLAWCRDRLEELGDRPSYLGPFW